MIPPLRNAICRSRTIEHKDEGARTTPGLPLRPFWKPSLPVGFAIVNLFDFDLK
jgi:hypothetical protein